MQAEIYEGMDTFFHSAQYFQMGMVSLSIFENCTEYK